MEEYATYLTFARGFVRRFAERVVGKDPGAACIVGSRPSDHILGGFLTPVRHPAPEDDLEEAQVQDLPQDSAYEQTSIGLEWPVDFERMAGSSARVEVSLCVFNRVLPTFDEQAAHISWKTQRPKDVSTSDGTPDPEADLIPVWRRCELGPFSVMVDLDELHRKRKLLVPITPVIQAQWAEHAPKIANRYPTLSRITVRRSLFTENGYPAWCGELHQTQKRDDWAADLDIRLTPIATEPGCGRISLRVINRTPPSSKQTSEDFDHNLYAVDLSVEVPKRAHKYQLFRELLQSYRYDLRLPAVGLNCHAEFEERPDTFLIKADPVPRKEQGRLEPRELERAAPTFRALRTDPVPVLLSILEAMREYDSRVWQSKIDALTGDSRREAEADRTRFRKNEIAAFERGIRLLESGKYPLVLRAFKYMNEAMGDVGDLKGLIPSKVEGRRHFSQWRLFQIVFIVAQLPGLASREYPELEHDADDYVDILWFAAGGGKTEAFFGVILWQAFFDRLRGKILGTTALVRFPLRLLAFQQLQRIARALAAADLIRIRERLGGAHFSLGYYVGGTQTPNSIDEERHQRYSRNGIDQIERKLSECPYCGSDVTIKYEKSLRLMEHHCENPKCPQGSGRLPIYIVDRDIERFLPTVVVATVDKLAQLGQQQRFANILGRFTLVCEKHGASFWNTEGGHCQAAKAVGPGPVRAEIPAVCDGASVRFGPFHDPGPSLLVQDELHLLSEELGAFDAHYETTAMHLMETFRQKPWKIIAATATITDFEEHAHQLYLKGARQFPAPGPEAFESFYYSLDEERVGRIFVSLVGVGRKHTPAVTKCLSIVYQELQAARDLARNDISGACDRYGLGPTTRQEFDGMLFYYELALTYVLTRKGSDQVAEAIESRVKRELAEVCSDAGELRIETFNGSVDMGEMIDAMRQIEGADPTLDPAERTRGLVTTNIISHGVDVDRFNIIVFAGFTRLVAEYIQASARVGRRFPGISILVATPQSERDRSIYERFGKFHEYLDRLVDPSAVNRWPVPALRRTVPGLLAGYLMGGAAFLMDRRLENIENVQKALGTVGSGPLQEAEVVRWLIEALGASGRPDYSTQAAGIISNNFALVVNAEPSSTYLENLLSKRLHPMRSLRDVDDPADIIVPRDDREIMRGLIRG